MDSYPSGPSAAMRRSRRWHWWPRLRADVVVVVYTRSGCGLCRRAEALVAAEARGTDITLVDIDTDDELVTRFGVRVPVVVIAGREVGAFEIRPGVIRRGVRRARWEATAPLGD